MKTIEVIFFVLLLGLIFALEGLGITYGRLIGQFLIIIFPLVLFALMIANKHKINFPKKLTFLFSLFLIFTLISTIFSLNFANSLLYLLIYLSVFLLFLYTNTYKNELAKQILYLIFVISFLLCIFSLIINHFSLFTPQNGYQLAFASFRGHNHLGDFLILPLIICLHTLLTKKLSKLLTIRYFLLTTFFLPFFLFSYSRSAYLSLVITLTIMIVYLNKEKLLNIKPIPLFIAATVILSS